MAQTLEQFGELNGNTQESADEARRAAMAEAMRKAVIRNQGAEKMKKVISKITLQNARSVTVTMPSDLRVDLQVAKIMTGQNFGETLTQAYQYAKKRGFNPVRARA